MSSQSQQLQDRTEESPNRLTRSFALFTSDSVDQLTKDDFLLEEAEELPMGCPVCLRNKECIAVLFYGQNRESLDLMLIWEYVAQQVVGVSMGACNLALEKEVAKAFSELPEKVPPLSWARLQGIPFILVYSKGWPKAFYNGDRGVQPLSDYLMQLACKDEYEEREQVSRGVSADNKVMMVGRTEPDEKTSSTDFRTEKPSRYYPSAAKVVPTGSQAAADLEEKVSEQSQESGEEQEPQEETQEEEETETAEPAEEEEESPVATPEE